VTVKVLVEGALAEGKALWPEMFPVEILEKRKEVMGTVNFNLQYQNDATLALGTVFRAEWMRRWSVLPEGLAVYQGVDLAVSAGRFADYFAIVTVGVSPDFEVFVLDVFRGRLSFERQMQAVIEKAREFDPVHIAVEATGYQTAFAQTLTSRTLLPVRPVYPNRDKVTRAWRLSALFENGRVFLGKGQEALEEELLAFPDGGHDDLFDALEMAVSMARGPFAAKLLRIPGI
jgi:predicted phage terminase large subunit-like protein